MDIKLATEVLREMLKDYKPDGIGGSCECDACNAIRPGYEALQFFIELGERLTDGKLVKVQLPYPATFTYATPEEGLQELTLSYEAAQTIVDYLGGSQAYEKARE